MGYCCHFAASAAAGVQPVQGTSSNATDLKFCTKVQYVKLHDHAKFRAISLIWARVFWGKFPKTWEIFKFYHLDTSSNGMILKFCTSFLYGSEGLVNKFCAISSIFARITGKKVFQGETQSLSDKKTELSNFFFFLTSLPLSRHQVPLQGKELQEEQKTK